MAVNKSVEANELVAKLKAHGSEKDICDLKKVFGQYKSILSALIAKERGPFSLNVLCILCRNIENVPTWREKICNKSLLELSIECLRQTRVLDKPEQIKTLACIYHIHRYIVKLDTRLPPELILKMSYMPFEVTKEHLLGEYYKTYWSVLADRMVYIEKLKSRLSISKLLPKLTEDITTIISLYTTEQFCVNLLTFVIKKLYALYRDVSANDLSGVYRNIFECIMMKDDLKSLKNMSERDARDVYLKFNECLYAIIENDSKMHFRKSTMDCIITSMISLLGNSSDVSRCFNLVYLKCFCCIFKRDINSNYAETVLKNLCTSCENTEKLGYVKSIYSTYPYIAQLLRLYIEYNVTNASDDKLGDKFDVSVQETCLKVSLYLTKKLSKTQQLSKCDGCNARSGLHDALRLTFTSKQMMTVSINNDVDLAILLPTYHEVVEAQYKILTELNKLGCPNHAKCLKKLQADIHNTAIMLNKAKYYQYSIKLFNIYLKNEIRNVKSDSEFKNVARALFNKGISELDCKLYDDAMKSAYLSLVFSGDQGMESDKYMSLVMDIKAKVLKQSEDKEESDEELQKVTVLTACKMLAVTDDYGNLKPYLSTLKFSKLLKHEFSMYVKLWPSIVPIAGVWTSLYELVKKEHDSWVKVEDDVTILRSLYEVMLETPTAVRSIHSDHYRTVVAQVLQRLNSEPPGSVEEKVVHATLLFLQSEYDIADATQKYGWKFTELVLDPDQVQLTWTLPQEQQALTPAIQAVFIWTEILPNLNTVPASPLLQHALQVAELFAQQFLHMRRCDYGLQLAHVCCELAHHLADHVSYLRNAGALLRCARARCAPLDRVAARAQPRWCVLVRDARTLDAALMYACELAMYYERCGGGVYAARLLRFVEARVLEAMEEQPELNLELAVGRLLEARASRPAPGLGAVNAVQRHYIGCTNTESAWCPRRLRALAVRGGQCAGGALSCRAARALRLWRRARGAAAAALPAASALCAGELYAAITDGSHEDAQVKVDNRLKHIMGLQPSNEIQLQCRQHKLQQFSPSAAQLESVRESVVFRRARGSPPPPCAAVPAFQPPQFLAHGSSCRCYACDAPYSLVLAYQTGVLEASAHFRSAEPEIARNYFDGASAALTSCQARLDKTLKKRAATFQQYVVDIVRSNYLLEMNRIEAEMLIESGYLELSEHNYPAVNDKCVRMHELMQECQLDPYLLNEFNNLLMAAARLRPSKKQRHVDLVEEFEGLKLSPNAVLRTPESKFVPVKQTNKVVTSDEVPNLKRKVIKLNLDDEDETVKEVKETKQQFKVPVPVTTKPELEGITPRPKSKPRVLVTQPSTEVSTPVSKREYFTPRSSPPMEQFFTPMTSLKTYTKKKSALVKNLESEFSTPKAEEEKENKVAERRGRSTRSNKLSYR